MAKQQSVLDRIIDKIHADLVVKYPLITKRNIKLTIFFMYRDMEYFLTFYRRFYFKNMFKMWYYQKSSWLVYKQQRLKYEYKPIRRRSYPRRNNRPDSTNILPKNDTP